MADGEDTGEKYMNTTSNINILSARESFKNGITYLEECVLLHLLNLNKLFYLIIIHSLSVVDS